MDPKIGSPNDDSPERLAAILSHCIINPKTRASAGAHESPAAPFDMKNYNTLSTFSQTSERFHRSNGPNLLETLIAPLFDTWKMTSTFGVCLLYQSIELSPDSRPVNQGIALTGWLPVSYQAPQYAERIKEAAWRSVDGQWKVFEYALDSTEVGGRGLLDWDSGNRKEVEGFLEAFADLLFEHDLQDILGLRVLPAQRWIEVNDGFEGLAWRYGPDQMEDGEYDAAEDCAWFFHGKDIQQSRTCRRKVVSSSGPPSEMEETENGSTSLQQEPEVEDFHSTVRRFSKTKIVEDIEFLENGDVKLLVRSTDMPPRPNSH